MKGEAVWLWKWLRRGKKTGNVSSRTCHVTAGTARFGMRRFGADNGGRRKGNRRGGSLCRQRGEGMARSVVAAERAGERENGASVPTDGIGIAAALVVFERVGKGGGVASEGEVVARVGGQHHRTRHVEAVEVARE